MRRLVKIASICALLGLLLAGWSCVGRHFRTENLDEFTGMSSDAREAYFSQEFPTRADIDGYLSDATILTSKPPILNDVTYFDTNRKFFNWHGREIKAGSWYTVPFLVRLNYRGRWRVTVVYSFCRELDDGSFTADNCYLVENKLRIYSAIQGQIEYVKGDTFDISKIKKPPFPMPSTQITIESLLARLRG